MLYSVMVAQKILVLLVLVRIQVQQPRRDDVKLRIYTFFAIFAPQVKVIIIFACGVCVYITYVYNLITLR